MSATCLLTPSGHSMAVDGVELFYREAGERGKPTVLLLHGDPSSSHQYRGLMPLLATRYHVLAPDYPGFGFTTVPAAREYAYTFDALADTLAAFLARLGLRRYALYVFDYGAPVGLRLALRQPDAVRALVSQNGNAYLPGIGAAFRPISAYFDSPEDGALEQPLRELNSLPGIKMLYSLGLGPDAVASVAPESYTLDAALVGLPGAVDARLALYRDYKSNITLYPRFQEYLRSAQPPLLAVWGAKDPFFIPAGAEAFKRDVPDAEVHLVDAGHFALETRLAEIAELMLDFLDRKMGGDGN